MAQVIRQPNQLARLNVAQTFAAAQTFGASIAVTTDATVGGQVLAATGSFTAPGLAFSATPGLGWYRVSGNTMGWASDALERAEFGIWGSTGSGGGALRILQSSSGVTAAGRPPFTFMGDTDTGMFLYGTDTLGLSTGGTARVVIGSGGLVGIGTASPSTLLDVFGGTVTLSANSSTSTKRSQFDLVPSWVDSTDASRKARVVFSVWDTAAREFMRAEATGTGATVEFRGGVVGIGTSSTPTQKLQVVGGNILIDGSRALHLGDTNWGIGRDIVAETGGALSSNTLQVKVGSLSTQGFQIVNSSNATLVEVRGSNGQAILRGGVQLTLSTYADNAAAVAGGLATDAVYKTTTGELRIVV